MNEKLWVGDAACARVDGDAWYPEVGSTPRPAKQICQTCPVINECLQWALATHEKWGVWGGLSAMERRKLAGKPYPSEVAA